jgi:cell division protein FtsB
MRKTKATVTLVTSEELAMPDVVNENFHQEIVDFYTTETLVKTKASFVKIGEQAKIILNEYSAKSLLMRDALNLDKFYTADLKLFVEVARKEIERLKEDNEYLNKVNIELSTLNTSLRSDRDNYKYIIKEVREYIEKHCKNERISNEVGYACYTMADTNELEHIMKILDKENKE